MGGIIPFRKKEDQQAQQPQAKPKDVLDYEATWEEEETIKIGEQAPEFEIEEDDED